MKFIDTHAHLNDKAFEEDLLAVLDNARSAGVSDIVVVGFDLESSQRALELTEHPEIWAAVGIHPHDAPQATPQGLLTLRELAKHPKVIAIGEIGLDYYWNTHPKDLQQQAFIDQIQLARESNLPFVVHDRDAHGDVLTILKEYVPYPAGFVMHCFSGSVEFSRECLRLGGYISLAGPVTFRNATKLLDVARDVPLDRLLVETDCPYLAPHPHRGQRNEPQHIPLIIQTIAEVRALTPELVGEHTTNNAKRLFKLKEKI